MGEEVNIEQKLAAALEQLAKKDNIIATLNDRISALVSQIENQSAALKNLEKNFETLNSRLIGSEPSGDIRKRKAPAHGAGAVTRGPLDAYFTVPANSSSHGDTSNDRMDDEELASNGDSGIPPNPNVGHQPDMQNHASTSGASFAAVATKNIAKPMPLQLGVTDRVAINQIIDLLNVFDKDDFDFVQLKGGSPPKIFPKNSIVKGAIIKLFQSNRVEFNSYSEKGEKRQSYIVRGLNYGDDSSNISLIRRSIADVGILGGVDCSRFLTGHMKRTADVNQTVLYRFTLDAKANESSLLQIKSINGYRVTIEKMRKSVVIQCHRCQRFQHTANSCSFEFRCVQCATTHKPGVCPRTVNKKLPLQCCNCVSAGLKNANHSSNNLNVCGFFKQKHSALFEKFVKNRTSAQPLNTNSNVNRSGRSVAGPSISSPDVFIGPTNANNPNTSIKKNKSNSKSVPASQNSSEWTVVQRKKSKPKSSLNSVQIPVNSGKSHTIPARSSGNSSQRVEALIGAFSNLLREFCNAS